MTAPDQSKDYTQHGEQAVILNLFEGNAAGIRVLDIGAADGKTFSNTRALMDRGASGVLVEPSPYLFTSLLANTAGYAGRCRCVMAAITGQGGIMDWHDSGGDLVSTLDIKHKELWEGPGGKVKYRTFQVPTISWAALLDANPGTFDFVNIDVEGTNLEVLRAMPIDRVSPTIVCVEHSPTVAGEHDRMVSMMRERGYGLFTTCGPNLFFRRTEQAVTVPQ